MNVGAPYVARKGGLRTGPVQSAAIDIVSPIGLIQRYTIDQPWLAAGEAQFIEWQEAIGHE